MLHSGRTQIHNDNQIDYHFASLHSFTYELLNKSNVDRKLETG